VVNYIRFIDFESNVTDGKVRIITFWYVFQLVGGVSDSIAMCNGEEANETPVEKVADITNLDWITIRLR
jgi:hypothetical protein